MCADDRVAPLLEEKHIKGWYLIILTLGRQQLVEVVYGIVDTRENRPGRKKLPGLEGGNDGWPYGWHYLDGEYRNWTVDFIVNLACDNGPVLEYICRAVDMMVGEIKNNQIF